MNRFSVNSLGKDLAGGVTTAIISLPLSLAFGVASGAGAQAGLYGAVCIGLFAAIFGSSSRLISEPTGPMTVIMTAVIASLQATHPEQGLAMAFTVVMVAGVFQMMIGFLKLGQFITLMPYSVISGFMSGIGILLIIMQIPPLLGKAVPPGGVIGILSHVPELIQDIHLQESILGLSAFALLLVIPVRCRRFCPPQLLALLGGTVISLVFMDMDAVRRIGVIPTGLPSLQLPVCTPDILLKILLDGAVLGTLGCIDTLLTSMIADSLTREQHDSNRELVGQGISNIVSGVFGGLPGAGATMGTVVNIQIGAKTAWAGIFRALILLTLLLGAAPLTRPIPMAVLAAIAIKVGIDILDWSFMKRAHHVSIHSTLMMYGVLFLTVFVDLIVAVGVGVFLANLLTIKRLSDLHSQNVKVISTPDMSPTLTAEEQHLLEQGDGKILLFHLSGPMIFGVGKAIAREHAAMAKARVLIIDLQDVPLLSVTVGLAIENMVLDALAQKARVFIVSPTDSVKNRLEKFEFTKQRGVSRAHTRKEALQGSIDWLDENPAPPQETV